MYHSNHALKQSKNQQTLSTANLLFTTTINTPLGPMTAIGDHTMLYLLEFADRPNLEQEIEQLKQETLATIVQGTTQPIDCINAELKAYFDGTLTTFTTPTLFFGTVFQKKVWHKLQQIPFGTTCSYSAMATTIGQPNAFRAVARANSMNKLALIVPCHRVIKADGDLSGYAGGTERKKWLIEHEHLKYI